ncbi:oxygenase MpaB family protein [Saccharopolyspora rosea]|uniref:Oxygenase MpaB family protein n=1 Tax=Saccharopolyspora rosea TaxID=524884 RepID=A0ABW3FWX2_9PSEU
MTRSADPLDEVVIGAALLAGGANVIMQLGVPGVGHGVLESRVDSGNLFHHPAKRTRTTITYLAVATMGTEDDRRRYRRAVNRVHAHVHSDESSAVAYNAFDPELQLWVAACLFKGFEDAYTAMRGRPIPRERRAALYAAAAPLGTTLQVRPEMWPPDLAAFDDYWRTGLARTRIDEPVRRMLVDIAELRFLPAVLRVPFRRLHLLLTTGFLPPEFRARMGLRWSDRDQRRFDRLTAAIGAVALRLPGPLRRFPFNVLLHDLRRRIRTGRPLV